MGSARFPGVPESGKKHKGEALAINDLANVVGYMQPSVGGFGLKRPYLWESTSGRELPIFPGLNVEPHAIDNNGNIVGVALPPRGVPTKLGSLPGSTSNEALKSNFGGTAGGGADVRANAISDSGTVVGTGDVTGGSTAVRDKGVSSR